MCNISLVQCSGLIVRPCVYHITQDHITQDHITEDHITQDHITQDHITQDSHCALIVALSYKDENHAEWL